jgi:hypothetical protein
LKKEETSDSGFSEDRNIVLHDIGHILSILELKIFNLKNIYSDNIDLNESINDIENLINQCSALFSRIISKNDSYSLLRDEIEIDNFIRQISRTIGFCAGLDNHVKFDFGCPEAFVAVESDGLFSSIINMISNSRKANKGHGNIVIKTRYHYNSLQIPEFVDLSISDDGVWGALSSVSHDDKSSDEATPRIKRGLKSIKNFVDKNHINLMIDAGLDVGTSVTLRIPLSQRSIISFDPKTKSHTSFGKRLWKIDLFTNNEEMKFNIYNLLNTESDCINVFYDMKFFDDYKKESNPDIIFLDSDIFIDNDMKNIIYMFHEMNGQIIIFTSEAPDPKSVHSNAIIINKPINYDLLRRTISAVKLVRLSNISISL